MLMTAILSLGLLGQSATPPRPTQAEIDAKTAKLKADIRAKAKARADAVAAAEARLTPAQKAERLRGWQRERAARLAQINAQLAEVRATRVRAQKEAEARAERLLPHQLEAQRQALQRQTDLERNLLEQQRQMLNFQSEMERNRILDRALNGRSSYGMQQAAPPEPPRIMNMPGQPHVGKNIYGGMN
jgi:hypothetical protein